MIFPLSMMLVALVVTLKTKVFIKFKTKETSASEEAIYQYSCCAICKHFLKYLVSLRCI